MKILLLTGKLAEPIVHAAARKCPSRYKVDILVMPVDVAALATLESISSYLKHRIQPKDYDLIMVSGAVQGSMRKVEEAVGIKLVKGPKHAVDIPTLLSICDPAELSPDIPADILLGHKLRKSVKATLKKIETSIASKPHITIGETFVPVTPPPIRVMSEVTDVHLLTEEKLLSTIGKRIEDGADIISLGFQPGVANPEKVKHSVRLIKKEYDFPLAVDSVIPEEIIAGAKAGADMIMSLEAGNIEKVADKTQQTPAVVIPYDSEGQFFARTVKDKLRLLERNIKTALKHNIKKIIADPVLNPINFSGTTGTFQSLTAYHRFKRQWPEIPMLMGLCNVTELIDADSLGVNALLTMFAAEVGASIVLVAEKSPKAQGSTAETAIASQMAALACEKKTSPIDLGVDLLMLKNKRMIDMPLNTEGAEIVKVEDKTVKRSLDPAGFFTIAVNSEEKTIDVLYCGAKRKILLRGKTASSIYNEILRRRLLSTLSHAFYLGVELGKAEEALRTGKNYVQEEKLFEPRKPIRIDVTSEDS